MTTAQSIINNVARTLIDQGSNRRWADSELLDYVNEAIKAIVIFKPSAYVKTTTMTLVSGAKQVVPTDCSLLLDVSNNMGSDGVTPGRVIYLIDRRSLNESNINWRSADPNPTVYNYMYDAQVDPKVFYVYPPNTGGQVIEILYSAIPSVISVGDNIVLDDMYLNSIIEYVLFRAFEKDSDTPNSASRSQTHFQLFTTMLGAKVSIDQLNNPNQTAEPTIEGTK